MTPVIRDATAADRPAIDALMQTLNTAEAVLQAQKRFREDRDCTLEAARTHVDFLIREMRESGGFHLTAEYDSRCVGWLMAMIETRGGAYIRPDHRRYGVITDLVVDENYRRVGAGRALLDEALSRFRRMKLPRVLLKALSGNETAFRLYRSVGFVDYAVEMDLDLI